MCGVAGAIDVIHLPEKNKKHEPIEPGRSPSELVYSMLVAQQSRGQQGAKITVTKPNNTLVSLGGYGPVEQIFAEEYLAEKLPGNSAIGHVRYPTQGLPRNRNLQPIRRKLWFGQMAIAHNGNLTNYLELSEQLEDEGAILSTTSDTEIILHLLQRAQARKEYKNKTTPRINCLINAISEACQKIRGSYSLLIMTANELIAVTDPYNIRPLALNRYESGFILASETSALDAITEETSYLHHIPAGNIVIIERNGTVTEHCYAKKETTRHCAFEQIYFSNPISYSFGSSTFEARKRIAEKFATHTRTRKLDFICATPDSSNVYAMELARASPTPQQYTLVKNQSVGRTFIEGDTKKRNKAIEQKFSYNRVVINGKIIGLVDDSLVRGNTSKKIVAQLRKYGAKEVHLLIMSPPIIYPCDLGIDTPDISELIATKLSPEEIAKQIGADSVEYLSLEELLSALLDEDQTKYCTTCFTGIPPSPEIGEDQIKLRQRTFSA